MATIRSFEDLEAWQKARLLVRAVYAVSSKPPFSGDFALRDQIRRAAISVLSNIAEGFERGGNAEFMQFLSVAKGSAGEIKAQCYAALDQHYLSDAEFAELIAAIDSVTRLLGGLIEYLRKSKMRGAKYRTEQSK